MTETSSSSRVWLRRRASHNGETEPTLSIFRTWQSKRVAGPKDEDHMALQYPALWPSHFFFDSQLHFYLLASSLASPAKRCDSFALPDSTRRRRSLFDGIFMNPRVRRRFTQYYGLTLLEPRRPLWIGCAYGTNVL